VSDHEQSKPKNASAPQTGAKDPAEDAAGQTPPAENVVDDDDTGANRNPNAPQHGGYGRPV
jgi:hypothetical protein